MIASDSQPPEAGHRGIYFMVESLASMLVCAEDSEAMRVVVDQAVYWDTGPCRMDQA